MKRIEVSTPDDWASICSASFVPLRVRSVEAAFRAGLSRVALTNDVSITRVTSNRSEVYRSDRLIAQEPRDDLLLSVHGAGTGTVAQEGRVSQLRRGTAALYDASRPYVLAFPGAMSEIVLQIPRASLGLRERDVRDVTARTLRPSGSLRALTGLIATASTTQGAREVDASGESIAEAAVCLLRAVVAPASAHPALLYNRYALRTAMARFIDDHLADPALCAELVAHVHHVSLRSAQLVFAEAGDTVAAHIRARRLQHAHTLLGLGSSVSAASLASGFTDAGTFTRAFKREYGVTPSNRK